MQFRARYRLTAVPFVVVTVCLVALVAVLWAPHLARLLAAQLPILPQLVIGVAALIPIAFCGWYLSSFAEIARGQLRVRSMFRVQVVELTTLEAVSVHGKASGGKHELTLHLQDAGGNHVLLPLNTWRDEDLVMARVLRATVVRRIRIEGEPMLVRRFSGLLDTYKSWDRRQAAA